MIHNFNLPSILILKNYKFEQKLIFVLEKLAFRRNTEDSKSEVFKRVEDT